MIEHRLNLKNIIIKDKNNEQIYFGGDQDWFPTKWQQESGCGPTTASAIIMYEYLQDICKKESCEKTHFLDLMKNVWNYVTPTSQGIYTLEMFADGYEKYIRDHYHSSLINHFIKIPQDKTQRKPNKDIFNALYIALQNNHPIAFLNLDHGEEKILYSWHWVTIVGLSYDDKADILNALIVDEGLLKPIDLGLWIKTSIKGGGFIYFEKNDE